MEIKVVSYNILNGFCNDNPPFKFDSERMNNALKIIVEQNPDILILTGAYFWSFAKNIDFFGLSKIFSDLYKNSAVRMDYIFSSHGFKIVGSGIVKNRFTEKMSDHYTVYAVLEI